MIINDLKKHEFGDLFYLTWSYEASKKFDIRISDFDLSGFHREIEYLRRKTFCHLDNEDLGASIQTLVTIYCPKKGSVTFNTNFALLHLYFASNHIMNRMNCRVCVPFFWRPWTTEIRHIAETVIETILLTSDLNKPKDISQYIFTIIFGLLQDSGTIHHTHSVQTAWTIRGNTWLI